MKFSFRQILASVGGAVIAAIIASAFGVKGTIVGVAIGSAAATIGTALVAQSIERGHAGRQAGGRPRPRLLHSPPAQAGGDRFERRRGDLRRCLRPPDRGRGGDGRGGGDGGDGVGHAVATRPGAWRSLPVADAPATERLRATTTPMQPALPGGPGGCAAVLLAGHRRHRGHRLRARPPADHRHRAHLGQAAGGRSSATRDNGNIVTPPSADDDDATAPRTRRPPRPRRRRRRVETTSTSTTTSSSSTYEHHEAPTGSSTTSTTPGASTTTTTTGAGVVVDHVDVHGVRGGYQPLNSAGRRSTKLAMPSLESSRGGDELLRHGLVVERGGAVDVEGAVGQPLGDPDGLRRPLGQAARQLLERRLQLGPRHQAVDQPDPVGLGRRARRHRRRRAPWPSGSRPAG